MSDQDGQIGDGDKKDGEPKMVPESDLLAVKGSLGRQLETANTALTASQTAEATQRARIAELEAQQEVTGASDDEGAKKLRDDIVAARKKLFEDQQALVKSTDEVTRQQGELAKTQLDATRAKIAAEYGVDETLLAEFDNSKDIEIAALKAAKAKAPDKKGLDTSGGGGSGGGAPTTSIDRAKAIVNAGFERIGKTPA